MVLLKRPSLVGFSLGSLQQREESEKDDGTEFSAIIKNGKKQKEKKRRKIIGCEATRHQWGGERELPRFQGIRGNGQERWFRTEFRKCPERYWGRSIPRTDKMRVKRQKEAPPEVE